MWLFGIVTEGLKTNHAGEDGLAHVRACLVLDIVTHGSLVIHS